MVKSFAIALAIALVGCTPEYSAEPPTEAYFPTGDSGMVAYGGNQLSADKAAIFPSLTFPQVRSDMIGTFGYPSYVTPTSDIYLAPGGQQIEVFYEGETATGFATK